MAISIIDPNKMLGDEQRGWLHRRLRFCLSRFDSRIRRTSVVLEAAPGPRGEVQKVCRISVTLHRAENVVTSVQDPSLAECITHAADRAGRAVGRAIDRSLRSGKFAPPDVGTV